MTMLLKRTGVEMSGEEAFLPRIRRLAAVSSVALGVIWLMAAETTPSHHPGIDFALFAGWVTMPTVLWGSIRRPSIRPLVFIPSALVTLGLVALYLTAAPESMVARTGWVLVTGGILLGGVLGGWFWFRWFPVPASLDHPFSPGRWALIWLHVAMIVGGLALVTLAWMFR
jgi:hypothetical protein